MVGVSEVGLEGAQEGKGVAGKSHRGSLVNKRHPSQDLGVAAKSSQGRRLWWFWFWVKRVQAGYVEHTPVVLRIRETFCKVTLKYACNREEMKGESSLWSHMFPQEERNDFSPSE